MGSTMSQVTERQTDGQRRPETTHSIGPSKVGPTTETGPKMTKRRMRYRTPCACQNLELFEFVGLSMATISIG